MNTFGLVLFIIFGIISLGLLVFGFVISKKEISKKENHNYQDTVRKLLYIGASFSISLVLMLVSIYWWNKINPEWYELLQTIVGGLIFGFSTFIGYNFFVLHYYGKGIPEKLDKQLYIFLMVGITVSICSLFLTLNGFADYINKLSPLANGINFSKGWGYPNGYPTRASHVSPNIAWYALAILSGAVLVYFYCDHQFYKEYGKHGIIESTFFIALPAGIIGARIFYVIGNFKTEFLGQEWWKVFAIWEGGLTILGGALTGIVVGVLWFMHANKGYNIFLAVDIILPSILVAQAVGRWGNFFNCEVHGVEVSANYFAWLPKIVLNNCQFSESMGTAAAGNIYAPLFLIESMANILGFFILAHVFGKALRKYTELGDIACGYFIWYGLIRAILEPLRADPYIMNNSWSWFWSLAFIAGGVLAIILNHTIRNIIRNKKGIMRTDRNEKWIKFGTIWTIIISVLSIAFLTVGLVLIFTSDYQVIQALNQFKIGVLITCVGICILAFLSISIPYIVRGKRNLKYVN